MRSKEAWITILCLHTDSKLIKMLAAEREQVRSSVESNVTASCIHSILCICLRYRNSPIAPHYGHTGLFAVIR